MSEFCIFSLRRFIAIVILFFVFVHCHKQAVPPKFVKLSPPNIIIVEFYNLPKILYICTTKPKTVISPKCTTSNVPPNYQKEPK